MTLRLCHTCSLLSTLILFMDTECPAVFTNSSRFVQVQVLFEPDIEGLPALPNVCMVQVVVTRDVIDCPIHSSVWCRKTFWAFLPFFSLRHRTPSDGFLRPYHIFVSICHAIMTPPCVSVSGQTPLHCAMMVHGSASQDGPINSKCMVQLLVSNGASLKTPVGQTSTFDLRTLLSLLYSQFLCHLFCTPIFYVISFVLPFSMLSLFHSHFLCYLFSTPIFYVISFPLQCSMISLFHSHFLCYLFSNPVFYDISFPLQCSMISLFHSHFL